MRKISRRPGTASGFYSGCAPVKRQTVPPHERYTRSLSTSLSYNLNHISSVMPLCLSTAICLPLLGRLRLPNRKSQNKGYVPYSSTLHQLLSKASSRTTSTDRIIFLFEAAQPEAHLLLVPSPNSGGVFLLLSLSACE